MTKRILIVDDDPDIRRLLKAILRRDYVLDEATCGEEALRRISEFTPDMILLDVMMPGIDGYETCQRIRSGPLGERVQVIMISAKSSQEEQLRGYEVGADDYVVKPIDPPEFLARIKLHYRLHDAVTDASSIRAQLDSRNLEIKRLVEERKREMLAMRDVAVFTLAKVAEFRDKETGDHLLRMRSYAQMIAEQLSREGQYASQIDEHFLEDLYRSSPLHDIGKVGISDKILLKPGRLTPEEFAVMQQHTVIGANVLDEAVLNMKRGGFLGMAATIARFHHERFDGAGYPAGLIGNEIPLPARIVAVADVFDALTSTRPYKMAWSPTRAKEAITTEAGKQFDPFVVEAFQARYDDIVGLYDLHGDRPPLTVGAMSFREYDLVDSEM